MKGVAMSDKNARFAGPCPECGQGWGGAGEDSLFMLHLDLDPEETRKIWEERDAQKKALGDKDGGSRR